MTRVAVVGLGLIGGSVALAAAARAWDRDGAVRERARRRGLDVADSLEAAVAGADLVVTAVPTADTPELLREVSRLAPGAILTDCASLKRPIAAAAETLGASVRFVAGHPRAGGRGRGVEAADAGIFRERPWILVRTARSDPPSEAAVEAFVRSLGSRPVMLDADRHDRAMTWVSHLPLVVSAALVHAASPAGGPDLAALAGPGLLDTTRLAGQPTQLALELALAGPEALARAIDALSAVLTGLSTALQRGDTDALRAFFDEAAQIRRSLEL